MAQETLQTISPLNAQLVLDYAMLNHAGQTDKGNAPIIDHCRRVGDMAFALTGSEIARAVGYLHDVLEDTDVRFTQLKQTFGAEVAGRVQMLTRPKDDHSYDDYIDAIVDHGDVIAVTVKLCDLLDNTNPDRTACHAQREVRSRNARKYVRAIHTLATFRAHYGLGTGKTGV